jgi:hypothetical protein
MKVEQPMRRKTRLIALVTILLSLTLAESLRSQIRARVELVVVPVSVRDASGRLVTGLTKDDFIVTEDGVRQNIANFSLEPAPLSAAIIIDDGMGANALKRVAPLIDVLTSGFSPNDEMIAFRYDHFVWKLSDFTTDHSVIQKSFSDLAKIAETRPPEGEPGEPLTAAPAWLRSIAGTITLGSIGAPKPIPSGADRPKQVKTSRVLHNAVYEAANALKGTAGVIPKDDPSDFGRTGCRVRQHTTDRKECGSVTATANPGLLGSYGLRTSRRWTGHPERLWQGYRRRRLRRRFHSRHGIGVPEDHGTGSESICAQLCIHERAKRITGCASRDQRKDSQFRSDRHTPQELYPNPRAIREIRGQTTRFPNSRRELGNRVV